MSKFISQNNNALNLAVIYYVSIIFLRFTFFPADAFVNFAMVAVGFFAIIYSLSNINHCSGSQLIFIGGLLISYLSSALLNANYERVFHGLIFILINCGVALALISSRKIYWIGLYFGYIVISYFALNFFIGIDPRAVFAHTSYNSISIILIASCIVMYIFSHIGKKKIAVLPAILTFFLCVWSLGRGGIISSLFLLFGIIYYNYPRRSRKIFGIIFLLLIIPFFFDVFFNSIVDYFSAVDAVSLAIERSESVEPRYVILNDYINNLNLYSFTFGVNIFENPTQAIIDVEYNFHNSFLNLHSRTGFYSFIVISATFYSLVKFYRANKLYFILFLTLILRCSTDGFIFFESFDFIYYYFILYALSSSHKFYHLKSGKF